MKGVIIFLCLIVSVFIGHVQSVGPAAAGPAAGPAPAGDNKSPSLGEKCPGECASSVLKCIKINKVNTQKFSLYPPPENDLGKCYCEDIEGYQKCLICNKPENSAKYNMESLKVQCMLLVPDASATSTISQTAATQPTNSNNQPTNNKSLESGNKVNNSTSGINGGEENKNKGGISGTGIAIIALVCIAGVGAFVFYTKKQKERPESMPFFGNSASSPNQYATLSTSKDISTTNLTSDYNTQYYSDSGAVVDNNQYYNQGYDQNYQDYNNQYPVGSYQNDVVAPSSYDASVPPSTYDTVATTQQSAYDVGAAVPPPPAPTTYESRRESMMPNSQPTTTNVSGAYVCAYKYDPQLDDELALQVNDQVQIIEEYEDGWMKAVNLTTGKEGMAPRVCIKEA